MSKLRTDQLVSVDQTATLDVKAAVAKLAVAVDEIIAGAGIAVDSTDPTKPVISATGGGSGTPGPSFAPHQIAAGYDVSNENRVVAKNILWNQSKIARSARFKGSGNWYIEFKFVEVGAVPTNIVVGLTDPDFGVSQSALIPTSGVYVFFRGNGQIFKQDAAYVGAYGAVANNDVIGIAYNTTVGAVSIYKNGVALVLNISLGSAYLPLAPAVAMEAGVGLSVQMLETPQYSVPAGHTYWD